MIYADRIVCPYLMTKTKKQIVAAINKKLGKALHPQAIADAVNVVLDLLIEELINDQSFSVHNFGTFSPYMFHGHKGMNISTGEMQDVPPTRMVKFHPHVGFTTILALQREKFLIAEPPKKKT